MPLNMVGDIPLLNDTSTRRTHAEIGIRVIEIALPRNADNSRHEPIVTRALLFLAHGCTQQKDRERLHVRNFSGMPCAST